MLNDECESILSHLLFHRSLIDDSNDDSKVQRLEIYMKMVEEMQQGVYPLSDDPFERSVSISFELVIKNRLNPWEIDLLEFSKMYLQRVRKSDDVNLIVAGKLILMAWEVFRLQTEDLLGRADEPEQVENFFETWDTDAIELYSSIEEPAPAMSIMHGDLELSEALRRPPSKRQVSLVELLDAFEEAKQEADIRAEIAKYMEKYRPKHFNDNAHKDTLEQDIAETWERITKLGTGPIALTDLCMGGLVDAVAVFVSVLFLANMERIELWQEKPPHGEIFVEIIAVKNIASVRDTGEVIDLTVCTAAADGEERSPSVVK